MYTNGSLTVKSLLNHQQKTLSKKIDNRFEEIQRILSDKVRKRSEILLKLEDLAYISN